MLLCIIIVVIYVFATQYSRRNVFKFFWWTHQLYSVLYALTIIHGSAHLLQAPEFHLYLIGPAVLFTLDKLISMSRKKVEIPVVKAELLPSGSFLHRLHSCFKHEHAHAHTYIHTSTSDNDTVT